MRLCVCVWMRACVCVCVRSLWDYLLVHLCFCRLAWPTVFGFVMSDGFVGTQLTINISLQLMVISEKIDIW